MVREPVTELIGEDRQRELLRLVRDSFAWSQAA
jgi:hypothetical protein